MQQRQKDFKISNLLFNGISKEFVKILKIREENQQGQKDDGFYCSKLLQKAKSYQFKKIPFNKKQQKEILQNSETQFQSLNQDYTLAIDGGDVQKNLIGFITTGGYSYKIGGSIAKGWVVKSALENKSTQMKVQVRNPRCDENASKYLKGKLTMANSLNLNKI